MLMMDRITEISLDGGRYAEGHVVAELDITPDLWFFSCHFPGDPVMPGCLGLDAMWQVVGFWLGWSGSPGKRRASGVGEVKFRGQITPDTSLVRYDISRDDQVALESEINRLHALYDAEIPRSEFEIRLGRGDYLGRIWIGRVSKDRRAIFPVVTDS